MAVMHEVQDIWQVQIQSKVFGMPFWKSVFEASDYDKARGLFQAMCSEYSYGTIRMAHLESSAYGLNALSTKAILWS